jgi:hypothetical protein
VAARWAVFRTRSSELLAEHRAVVLAAPTVPVFLAWAGVGGGFRQVYWYPGALLVLALVVAAVAAGSHGSGRPGRAVRVALVCLSAFTVWSFCSIAWAGVRGEAWDGANRTLLYLTVYALFVVLPWTLRGAVAVLGLYSLGVAAIAAWVLWRAARAADPTGYLEGGRFEAPIGYHNANCAVFTFALVILALLLSRRQSPIVVRGAAAAGCVVLTVLSFLAQSRGWLVAGTLTALLFVAVVPWRTRALIALGVVGAAVAPLVGRALDVYSAGREGSAGPELVAVAHATVVAAAAAGAFGILWGLFDRVYVPSSRRERRADRAVGAALAGGIVLAGVLVVLLGHPREWASNGWRDFKDVSASAPSSPTGSYLTRGVTGNRYDLWRVALRAFERRPVTGVGADNFEVDYIRERRTLEEPLYPHSLELRALAQTGIVGALLLAGFVAAAFAAAWRPAVRHGGGFRAAVVVGAAYWLLHGSVDWFWEMPAASAPVFAALGIAAALPGDAQPPSEARGRPRRGSRARRLVVPVAALLAAAAAASYAFPLLSALYVRNATRTWKADETAAYTSLDRARRLNPLSDQPDLVGGAIASRLGQPDRMRQAFAAAVRRNPHSWYGFFELGVADSLTGHRRPALAHFAEARRLNPLEPVIASVEHDVREGAHIDSRAIDAIFLRRVSRSAHPVSRPSP